MHPLSVTLIPLSYHCLRWFCCNNSTCLVLQRRRDTMIHSTHHLLMVLQLLSHLSASVEHWCVTCCCLLLSAVRSWDTEVRSALSNLAEGERRHQYSVLHNTMVHCNTVLNTIHTYTYACWKASSFISSSAVLLSKSGSSTPSSSSCC